MTFFDEQFQRAGPLLFGQVFLGSTEEVFGSIFAAGAIFRIKNPWIKPVSRLWEKDMVCESLYISQQQSYVHPSRCPILLSNPQKISRLPVYWKELLAAYALAGDCFFRCKPN